MGSVIRQAWAKHKLAELEYSPFVRVSNYGTVAEIDIDAALRKKVSFESGHVFVTVTVKRVGRWHRFQVFMCKISDCQMGCLCGL